ncbi:MAG: two-component regulator propeller domain-containing protein [Acidobacteriota bacterium]|nr:ATP-binding protein [Blastocatellia bacterium]MDW8411980.1 two-component regulator propeller domain-containing protein [Acidobacteriota bacterium]
MKRLGRIFLGVEITTSLCQVRTLSWQVCPLLNRLTEFVIFLLVFSGFSYAAEEVLRGRLFFSRFTVADGLPHNNVRAIASDDRGYLWVGTQDGVAVYNGRVWTPLKLPNRTRSNDVFAMISASDGMWFGTNGGGLAGLLRNGRWVVYDTTNSNIPNNLVFSLLESRSVKGEQFLWVGLYGKGLVKLIDGKFERVDCECLTGREVVLALHETGDGAERTLWIGTREGLVELTAETGKCRRHESSLFRGGAVTSILAEGGMLYVGTTKGLAVYDGQEWRLLSLENGFLAEEITALALSVLPEGEVGLLCGTQRHGVIYKTGDGWKRLGLEEGLPEGRVNCLYDYRSSDGMRMAWLGSYKSGLLNLMRRQWSSLHPFADRTGDNILSMAEIFSGKQRQYWIGSDRGLAVYSSGQWRYYAAGKGLTDNIVRVIVKVEGARGRSEVLVGTNQGIDRYVNGRWSRIDVRSGGIDPEVRTILQTEDKSIWIGTFRGLGRLKDGKWEAFFEETGQLPNNGVNCLLEMVIDGKKVLWAGTYGGGLAYYTEGQWGKYNSSNGLPNDIVLALLEQTTAKGRYLWVGTHGGGVARLSLDGSQRWLVFSDSTSPAIRNNVVYQIREDRQGRIYLFTNRGVSRLTATAGDSYEVYNFSTADGLPSDKCNAGASMVDSFGRVWAGTINGVGILDLPQYEDRVPKKLFIEKVAVNGEILLPEQINKLATEPLEYYRSSIEFEYTLLCFTRGDDTVYSTQLMGFDSSPSEWTSFPRRQYTNLPAGRYIFRVVARDHAGNISTSQLSFSVASAPWFRWWAWMAYVTTAGGLILGGYFLRMRAVRRRHENKLAYLYKLLESCRVINSRLDLDGVLRHIAMEAASLVDGEPSGIGLVKDGCVEFDKLWDGATWAQVSIRMDGTVASLVARTGDAMIVTGQEYDGTQEPKLKVRYKHGWMCVPVKTRDGKVVGVLEVRSKGQAFSRGDLALVESLANQAAVAMENAALYGVLEEQKRQLERLYKNEQEVSSVLERLSKMKSDFLVLTSHEMRTPLTVIKGYTELMLDYGPLTKFQKEALAACRRMIERMERVLSDIFEMLRINDGQMKLSLARLDLLDVVRGVIAELRPYIERRRQRLIEEAEAELRVIGDYEKLRRAIKAVMQNAIKFTPDGGTIAVKLEGGKDVVRLSIRDDGIGVEPGELDKVFEAFYTASDTAKHTSGEYEFMARGAGLGLAIARGYIQLHGGRIWLESRGKNSGCSVHIVLPSNACAAMLLEEEVSGSAL